MYKWDVRLGSYKLCKVQENEEGGGGSRRIRRRRRRRRGVDEE